MANGMTAERLLRQWEQIEKLADKLKGITVLKGVEVDILEPGGLDIDDNSLSHADWVVASVRFSAKQPRAEITKRIVNALANPNVCASPIRPAEFSTAASRTTSTLEAAAAENSTASF